MKNFLRLVRETTGTLKDTEMYFIDLEIVFRQGKFFLEFVLLNQNTKEEIVRKEICTLSSPEEGLNIRKFYITYYTYTGMIPTIE